MGSFIIDELSEHFITLLTNLFVAPGLNQNGHLKFKNGKNPSNSFSKQIIEHKKWKRSYPILKSVFLSLYILN